MAFRATHTIAHNVVALFRKPESGAELVTQAIYGAGVKALKTHEKWTFVCCEDRYQGWLLSGWLAPVEDTSDYLETTIAPLFANIVAAPAHDAPILTRLTVSARVVLGHENFRDSYAPLRRAGGGLAYTHAANLSVTFDPVIPLSEPLQIADLDAELKRRSREALLERLIATAGQLIGTPYLWGGTTPFGIDCSGFTQLLYRINGILLLRDSSQQIDDRRFAPVEDDRGLDHTALAPGDLLFFGAEQDGTRRINHVGMAVGDGTFIHSAGAGRGVIVTPCCDEEFTVSYLGARRLLPDADLGIDAA